MMAILFSFYSLAIGIYSGVAWQYLVMLSLLAILSIALTYRWNERGLLLIAFSDAMILSHLFHFKNAFDTSTLSFTIAILLPMLVALEHTLNKARGMGLPWLRLRRNRKYVPPMLYLAAIIITFGLLSRFGLYDIYFMGEGQTNMQILLIIGVATLYFMPFYEGMRIERKR
ncbi:MAG TPA: hypothetical protein PK718_01705 [Candidatus Methanofastidiosa archaeon]|nr:hypothetical protein [Candidatus Methanofastidiosa archaeon]